MEQSWCQNETIKSSIKAGLSEKSECLKTDKRDKRKQKKKEGGGENIFELRIRGELICASRSYLAGGEKELVSYLVGQNRS
ncbi:MAG TPA: hypothetical protein VH413_15180 [Verrucomicrobiae bacterium]|jgi:hypothetical protein|nr:hypothetical protein [Verrucomicrobiae bacterium]